MKLQTDRVVGFIGVPVFVVYKGYYTVILELITESIPSVRLPSVIKTTLIKFKYVISGIHLKYIK